MKKLILRVLRKTRILQNLRIDLRTKINCSPIIIPSINGIGFDMFLNPSEPWMGSILRILIYKCGLNEGTFYDIGANIGQTLINLKSVKEDMAYLGFEPNPSCVHYLISLIKLNKFQQTEIIPAAIGADTGIKSLFTYNESETDSSASLINQFRSVISVKETMHVPVFRFSELALAKSDQVTIVKIDVEGSEVEVVESMVDKIKNDKPVIIIEILPDYDSTDQDRVKRKRKLQEILYQLDYKILRLVVEKGKLLKTEQLMEFDSHSNMNLTNYILAHRDFFTKMKREFDKDLAFHN